MSDNASSNRALLQRIAILQESWLGASEAFVKLSLAFADLQRDLDEIKANHPKLFDISKDIT